MTTSISKRFSEGWTQQNKWLTYYYLFFFFLRGLCYRLFVQSAKGILLIGKNVRISYPAHLQLGKDTIIEDGAEINCLSSQGIKVGDRVTIGKHVMMGPRVSIYAENHVFDNPDILMKDQGVEKKEVIIEDDCWIASNSIILAGVTIGKGSVIAAGSVVTENVAPYSVVAGVPAKWIKSRKAN